MKKVIFSVLLVLTLLLSAVCCTACNRAPYALKSGAYGFETCTITNKHTKEITHKSFDDILNNKDDFREWGNLFSFQIFINENERYFCTTDHKYFVLNEGLAFEVTDTNTLQLHFPYWRGYDFNFYDVVIILGLQQTYG